VSALGSVPFGVAFVSDSDDGSEPPQEDEDDADEALVLLDVLASEHSGAVVVAKSDTGLDDGRVDLVEEFSGRARLNAANAAASLGVEDPSSLPSAGEV